jgi:hypothetical protein
MRQCALRLPKADGFQLQEEGSQFAQSAEVFWVVRLLPDVHPRGSRSFVLAAAEVFDQML